MEFNQGAALGANVSYRFDGDFVQLSADVHFNAADAASGSDFRLQLWADPARNADDINGILIAELPLQALPGLSTADACVAAMPPAGDRYYAMGMALVACAPDAPRQVRDLALFSNAERFCLPRILGDATCRVADGLATIAVGGIGNPRSAENLSGDLTLELWALGAAYEGGAFLGTPLAVLPLGVLAGGAELRAFEFSVPVGEVPPAQSLTVMVREWTAAGYVTRDYRSVQMPPVAVLIPAAEANELPERVSPADQPAAKPRPAQQAAPAAALNLNTAKESDIAAIKGISAKLARALVQSRPFASFDEVLAVKGMGPKLLEKLRACVKL